MKTLTVLLSLWIPHIFHAQNWTPAEQEVIDFIDNCQAMSSADYDVWFDACWDEDIIYVDPSNKPTAAIDRNYGRQMRPIRRANILETYRTMTPISVKVYGNTAVIYYHIRVVTTNRDGSANPGWNGLSTETVIKRDGAWKVINKNDWPYPPASGN